MYNEIERKKVLDNFTTYVEGHAFEYVGDVDMMQFNTPDGLAIVRDLLARGLRRMFKKAVTGVEMEDMSLIASSTESVMTVTVKTKAIKSQIPFKEKFSIVKRPDSTNESLFVEMVNGIYELYKMAIEEFMIEANLKEFNAVVKQYCDAAKVPYSVSVISPYGQGGRSLAYIDANEIVFVAKRERVFEMDKLYAMRTPDYWCTEETVAKARDDMAAEIVSCQTTLELLQRKGGAAISFLCDLKLRRPKTYLKKVTGRNALHMNAKATSGLAYVMDDVDGVDVFTMLNVVSGEGDADSYAEILIAPINMDTFEPVDYDVKEALAKKGNGLLLK